MTCETASVSPLITIRPRTYLFYCYILRTPMPNALKIGEEIEIFPLTFTFRHAHIASWCVEQAL